jgi:gluconolactonase
VRLRPDGSGEVVATGIYLANGTAIDPNEEYVYVLQSTTHDCVRIAINADGTHGEVEPYGPGFGAVPRGMAFDAAGNLIVTLPGEHRLVVIDVGGGLSTLVHDPSGTTIARPTNCAFGGDGHDELYVAHMHADHVARLPAGSVGHPVYNLR